MTRPASLDRAQAVVEATRRAAKVMGPDCGALQAMYSVSIDYLAEIAVYAKEQEARVAELAAALKKGKRIRK